MAQMAQAITSRSSPLTQLAHHVSRSIAFRARKPEAAMALSAFAAAPSQPAAAGRLLAPAAEARGRPEPAGVELSAGAAVGPGAIGLAATGGAAAGQAPEEVRGRPRAQGRGVRRRLPQGGLGDRINEALEDEGIYIDVTKVQEVGKKVRQMIMDQPLQAEFEDELKRQWERVSQGNEGFRVTVRSSATAEDFPDASFAGQQETYPSVLVYENLKENVHQSYAPLVTDHAVSNRHEKGFDHRTVQLCACVQQMVRSEAASAGVMFTLDTEPGFQDAVFVTSAWGFGETVVGGTVNPDEFHVFEMTLRQGKEAVVSETMGSKLAKTVHAKEGGSKTTDTIPERRAGRFKNRPRFSSRSPRHW
ncbi:unnamed protein product [Prorocentrum cordatum]|uniref:pyruvate, water dikinase n=1 Tax=Prorocentrum cordatum TaxID=2364126 RepID=A0ABN9UTB5_9DINO|nr:unnamed protein product [Polarella glacialis]